MQQRKFPSLMIGGRLLAALVATGLVSTELVQQPAEANDAKIRKFGFAGTYRGVVVGRESSRSQNQATLNNTKVSRIQTERLPSKRENSVDGLTEGKTIRVLKTTRVTKRRVVVKTRYFGISNNTFYGERTIASGSETVLIRKLGTEGLRFMGTYSDLLREKVESTNLVVARRDLMGKLEKR